MTAATLPPEPGPGAAMHNVVTDAAVEAAARQRWRDDHGTISSPDRQRTPESDEREKDENGFRRWDRSVSDAVKSACRLKARKMLEAALPHLALVPAGSEAARTPKQLIHMRPDGSITIGPAPETPLSCAEGEEPIEGDRVQQQPMELVCDGRVWCNPDGRAIAATWQVRNWLADGTARLTRKADRSTPADRLAAITRDMAAVVDRLQHADSERVRTFVDAVNAAFQEAGVEPLATDGGDQ